MASVKNVFLSSTARDLHEHRKADVGRLLPALDELLHPEACDVQKTGGFRSRTHDDLLDALRSLIEQCLGRAARVSILHSLQETGCDILVEVPAQGVKHGIQVKGWRDINERYFARCTLAQIEDSRQHGLARLYVVFAGDLTDRSQRQKVRGLCSRISKTKDDYVVPIPPENAWAVFSQQAPMSAAQPPPISLPPQSYFAHPYALQRNFTGRVREREMLTQWLTEDEHPVLALTAIGGMGKSALTWAWVQRDVLGFPLLGSRTDPPDVPDACRLREGDRPEGVLWWSFYDREATFPRFLDKALTYASGGSVRPRDIPSPHEKVEGLVAALGRRRLLLVLDGLERELRAYAGLSAAYQGDSVIEDAEGNFRACTDPHAGEFLRTVAALPLSSRVLLTTRLFPRELDDLAGCRREELVGMERADAVAFFRAQGVKGTRAEIEGACKPYGYLPLALRLLAGVIVNDKRDPGDVGVAERYPVVPELKGKQHHHILQVAYDALAPRRRTLLSRIAAFRGAVTYDALLALNPFKSEKPFDAALNELIERGLLFFHREQRRYDLHPVVRQHAYDRLAGKRGVHTRLRDYFAAIPAPDENRVQTLDDVAPVIELYHHTVRAGQHEEAVSLIYDRIRPLLFYRLGEYQAYTEALRSLVVEPDLDVPGVSAPRKKGFVLNCLANSLCFSGHPREAIPLLERSAEMEGPSGINYAVDIGNLAVRCLLPLGNLRDAQRLVRRRMQVSRRLYESLIRSPCAKRKSDAKFCLHNEAIGHSDMGYVLALQGHHSKAEHHFTAALRMFKDRQSKGIVHLLRCRSRLIAGEPDSALREARQARRMADEERLERDIVRAESLLATAKIAKAQGELAHGRRRVGYLREAEIELTQALTRCRRINLVELEPDILLAWAKWHRMNENAEAARKDADEALAIADRCGYRLKQADIHNFLALLVLDAGVYREARRHAEIARDRALCNGPPHSYEAALDEADRLLAEIEARGD